MKNCEDDGGGKEMPRKTKVREEQGGTKVDKDAED